MEILESGGFGLEEAKIVARNFVKRSAPKSGSFIRIWNKDLR
ncbi:hypothetical protein LEP1GSC050_3990 [Leptospira broomii serovar Hurstbridge str. 5399]|uniref:Uncharacterized protein n=1 Tax=Leptospira broomii serovar Hurstbridge str. 5399 TaxID=1049789 RepID=T0F8X7_9LEPT|nr:hypothetical protein LEP1GSC050_3990 [Leptospira broomii serovar Hurstbridge str. 5399]